MAKANLNDLANLQNETTATATINANNAVIETAFNNTLSRDGTAPNQMNAALDMNSNQIYNLPAPSSISSPARLIDVVSNPSIVIPGTGTSGHVVPYLDTTNIWSGNQYFKNGTPWADVRAYGAVGDAATSDDVAIQTAIDYMYSTYGGGVVFFPPGIYRITIGLTIKGAVRLVGSGRTTTHVSAFLDDVTTITFDSSCIRGCSVEHMTVLGYFNADVSLVTTNAMFVSENLSVITDDVTCWYGNAALFTKGVDSYHHNTWFMGCVNCVVSIGANWYIRSIFDSNGSFASQNHAFEQGESFAGATSQENHFFQCDFSGVFAASILIDDTGGSTHTVSVFDSCVISSPVNIVKAYWTYFNGCEFGSTTFALNASTGGTVSVVGCVGFGIVLNLVGSFVKAGNFNIT